MTWIKCADKRPEPETDVLTYCISDGNSRQGFPNTYEKDEKYVAVDLIVKWREGEPSFRTERFFGIVTHWMPIPSLPEEG